MREIKFRVWHKVERRIYRPQYFHFSPEGRLYGVLVEKGRLLSADDFTIMQYTGLKDRNGKEIYEGDILRYPRGIIYLSWESPTFRVSLRRDGEAEDIKFHLSDMKRDTLEVIGNVYEHPELLEVNHD